MTGRYRDHHFFAWQAMPEWHFLFYFTGIRCFLHWRRVIFRVVFFEIVSWLGRRCFVVSGRAVRFGLADVPRGVACVRAAAFSIIPSPLFPIPSPLTTFDFTAKLYHVFSPMQRKGQIFGSDFPGGLSSL